MSAIGPIGIIGRARSLVRSDEDLLKLIQRGDAASFEAFYRRYHDAVLGYCLARLGDRPAAEDATQEVFLRVHGCHDTPIESGKAWLFTVARNVVIDASRRRRTAPDTIGIEAALQAPAGEFDESAFLALDVTSNVFVALRRLPSRDRKALVLRDFQDQSSAQIAEEFGMKAASVDVLLCRARAAFGRAYTEVSEMPFACRQATELIFRESGSGITDRQQSAMQAHLGSCPRCEAEYTRAHSPRHVAGLLPWLWLRLDATGLPGAFERLRVGSVSALTGINLVPTEAIPAGAKAAVGVAVTIAVLAPGLDAQTAVAPVPRFTSALSQTALPASGAPADGFRIEPTHQMTERTSLDGSSAQNPAHTNMDTGLHSKAMIPDGHDMTTASDTHSDTTHAVADTTAHEIAPMGATTDRATATNPRTGTTTDTHATTEEAHW